MSDELQSWPDTLQSAIDSSTGPLTRVTVLRETDSTQDAARRANAAAGEVIVAGRQVRGRGRLGRVWADTEAHGIAATFVLARESGERLAFVSAVAAAMTAETQLNHSVTVGIKWPNDLVVDQRKLGGILIEQYDDRALVGIGMNVSQTQWPTELESLAVSFKQLGATASRERTLSHLLRAMNETLTWPEERLTEAYHARHVLRDRTVRFQIGSTVREGRVIGISVQQGLCIVDDGGETWLPAAATRVIGEWR